MGNEKPKVRTAVILHAVFKELANLGGEAAPKELIANVSKSMEMTDYENGILEKSGFVRWHTDVRWYSVNAVKAGIIQKKGGRWYLTDKGERLVKSTPEKLFEELVTGYEKWRSENPPEEKKTETQDEVIDSEEAERLTTYEMAAEEANSEIMDRISELGPYDFQDLVAELLEAMGYHVRLVAPPGADGGVDLHVYQDPIGIKQPHIVVQVKHRKDKATAKEFRELYSLLRRNGDIGLFVSTSGFTSSFEGEARLSDKHVEMMDIARVIELWCEHYEKISEKGKLLLPLVKLYFLAPPKEA